MTRKEAKTIFDSFGKTFTLDEARQDIHDLIDKIFDDRKKSQYDLKVLSDDNGYLSGLSWYGRAKPNTLYEIYVEPGEG